MSRRLVFYGSFAAVCCSLSAPAYAYLDAATGSMLVQALIGGVAAAAMFGRHYIAKTKSAVLKVFGKGPPPQDR